MAMPLLPVRPVQLMPERANISAGDRHTADSVVTATDMALDSGHSGQPGCLEHSHDQIRHGLGTLPNRLA